MCALLTSRKRLIEWIILWFIKLMDRLLPVNVLLLLEDWFGKCFACVKWDSLLSCTFQLTRGIWQGGVLSPYLFALYVDDILAIVEKRRSRCFYQSVCVSIVMYADDILLLSPSVTVLQELLYVCENVLVSLDFSINPKKSVCTRIGPRCNTICCDIVSSKGHASHWVDSVRYLVWIYGILWKNGKIFATVIPLR